MLSETITVGPCTHSYLTPTDTRQYQEPPWCAHTRASAREHIYRSAAGHCRPSKPAKGVRKHGSSATGHGDEEQEQERSPGRLLRGSQGMG